MLHWLGNANEILVKYDNTPIKWQKLKKKLVSVASRENGVQKIVFPYE